MFRIHYMDLPWFAQQHIHSRAMLKPGVAARAVGPMWTGLNIAYTYSRTNASRLDLVPDKFHLHFIIQQSVRSSFLVWLFFVLILRLMTSFTHSRAIWSTVNEVTWTSDASLTFISRMLLRAVRILRRLRHLNAQQLIDTYDRTMNLTPPEKNQRRNARGEADESFRFRSVSVSGVARLKRCMPQIIVILQRQRRLRLRLINCVWRRLYTTQLHAIGTWPLYAVTSSSESDEHCLRQQITCCANLPSAVYSLL